MSGATVDEMAAQVAALMEARLGIRGAGLAEKLRRGRRRLPRRIRREAECLVRAAEQAKRPKLRAQVDQARIAAAHHACLHYLKPIGAARRRRAVLLDMLTGIGGGVFATMLLVLLVLVWRGLV